MTKRNYSQIKSLVKNELEIVEKKILSSIDISIPLNLAIKEFLTLPSKRIRCVLPLLFAKAINSDISDAQLELLSAVELVHNASLIHDDIIDDSELRRGKKTLYKNFGNKMGVIAGDYLLALAMEKISDLNSLEILSKFSYTLKKMCIGEINQNFERFKIGTIENYIEKSKNKTAYLFETSLVCFGLLDKSIYEINNLGNFGLNSGIAFQIRDDLLNILNVDKSKFSDDIKNGIYTAPIIYTGSKDNYFEGIEKTKNLLNNYVNCARISLQNLPQNIYKTALIDFLELLSDV